MIKGTKQERKKKQVYANRDSYLTELNRLKNQLS